MFNNLSQPTPASSAVDDIFAETDTANRATPNKVNIEAQAAGLAAQNSGSESGLGDAPRQSKLKFILILVLAVVILAAAAYLVYSKMTRPTTNEPSLETTTPSNDVAPVNNSNSSTDLGTVVVPETQTSTSSPVATQTPDLIDPGIIVATGTPIVSAPVDSDGDSLTDAEEALAGTNINLIDSDFDGLSDYEELRVYGTNPLNPDTDGDGYNDGDEVTNGYNPKGEGVLLIN